MVIDSVAVAWLPGQLASRARTVTSVEPIDAGTPLTVPFESITSPAGNAPSTSDHDVVPVPPAACKSARYIAWYTPGVSVVVAIDSGAGSTVMMSGFASLRSGRQASCASISAVVVPHVTGTPAMLPENASSVTPTGKSPAATVQVKVPRAQ